MNAMVPIVADSLYGFRKIISPFVPNSLMCWKVLTLPPESSFPTHLEPAPALHPHQPATVSPDAGHL